MGYFPVRYDSRVVIYDRKMFIRLTTGLQHAAHYWKPYFWSSGSDSNPRPYSALLRRKSPGPTCLKRAQVYFAKTDKLALKNFWTKITFSKNYFEVDDEVRSICIIYRAQKSLKWKWTKVVDVKINLNKYCFVKCNSYSWRHLMIRIIEHVSRRRWTTVSGLWKINFRTDA